jgi:hypothetical protein
MSDFRRRHGGMLPGETGGFFGRLATLQEELRQVRADLQIAVERRATLPRRCRPPAAARRRAPAAAWSNSKTRCCRCSASWTICGCAIRTCIPR